MKQKTIALLLCLVVLLAGCGKKEEQTGIVGSWEAAVDMSVVGENIEPGTTVTADVLLKFEENGTGLCRMDDKLHPARTVTFRYLVEEGKLLICREDAEPSGWDFQLEGKTLTLSQGGMQAVFTRKT